MMLNEGFHTTRWTRVCRAKVPSEDGQRALSELCAAYYDPVVAFLRCSLRDPVKAQDLSHSFFAQILAGEALSAEQHDSVRQILSGGRHLLDLINEVLDISRIESGRLGLSPEAVSVRGKGAGMITAAGVVGMYAIGFAAATVAAGLAVVLPLWAAILIVTVLLLIGAWVLVLAGRRTLRTAPPAGVRTRETLKEDARWARQQMAR